MDRLDRQLAAPWRSIARSWCHSTRTPGERADAVRDLRRLIVVADLDGDLADRVLAADGDRHDVADQTIAVGDRAHHPRELPGAMRNLDSVGAVEHVGSGSRAAVAVSGRP